MSGGDFMSRSEAALCTRRRIDDRVAVVRDLQRVIVRHGKIGAADQLGISTGQLDRVIERKAAITADLLMAMYGVTGATLACGLAVTRGIDASVTKEMGVVDAGRVVEPVATKTPPWRRHVDPNDAEHLELVALLKRACVVIGSNRQAAERLGFGLSTLGFLKAGSRPFSGAQASRLRVWGWIDANSGNFLPDTAATATRVAPPAPVEMPLAAVAAAPAEPLVSEVALPPSICPAPGDDPVAGCRAVLIGEIADVEARQVAAEIEYRDMAMLLGALAAQIDAARDRLPVLRQAVAALDAVVAALDAVRA